MKAGKRPKRRDVKQRQERLQEFGWPDYFRRVRRWTDANFKNEVKSPSWREHAARRLRACGVSEELTGDRWSLLVQFVADIELRGFWRFFEEREEDLRLYRRADVHLKQLHSGIRRLKNDFSTRDRQWRRLVGGEFIRPANPVLATELQETLAFDDRLNAVRDALSQLRTFTLHDAEGSEESEGAKPDINTPTLALTLYDFFKNGCGRGSNESTLYAAWIGNALWEWRYATNDVYDKAEGHRRCERIRKLVDRERRRRSLRHPS